MINIIKENINRSASSLARLSIDLIALEKTTKKNILINQEVRHVREHMKDVHEDYVQVIQAFNTLYELCEQGVDNGRTVDHTTD